MTGDDWTLTQTQEVKIGAMCFCLGVDLGDVRALRQGYTDKVAAQARVNIVEYLRAEGWCVDWIADFLHCSRGQIYSDLSSAARCVEGGG